MSQLHRNTMARYFQFSQDADAADRLKSYEPGLCDYYGYVTPGNTNIPAATNELDSSHVTWTFTGMFEVGSKLKLTTAWGLALSTHTSAAVPADPKGYYTAEQMAAMIAAAGAGSPSTSAKSKGATLYVFYPSLQMTPKFGGYVPPGLT